MERLMRFRNLAREGWKKRKKFIGSRPGQWPGWAAFLKSCWRMSRPTKAERSPAPGFLPITDPKWKNFCYRPGMVANVAKLRHQMKP